MAGTINLALTQQFDMDGRPLSGGLLSFFQASSTTPQNAFQDEALTLVLPNPVVLDASGRIPMFYLADGHIKIRLTDKRGVVIVAADNLLVTGGSSGAAPPPPVDASKQLQTGDIKTRFGTGQLTGFARCNGNTIGNSTSGATELADTSLAQDLFVFLYATSLPIFQSNGSLGTKSGNALTDFGANMRMGLPDLRGRVMAGMDDMGATAANRLTTTYFGQSGIVLGNVGGSESKTLTTAQLPSHAHGVSGGTSGQSGDHSHGAGGLSTTLNGAHSHTYLQAGSSATGTGSGTSFFNFNAGSTTDVAGDHTHAVIGSTAGVSNDHTHTFSVTSTAIGSGTAHSVANPAMVMTFYIKL